MSYTGWGTKVPMLSRWRYEWRGRVGGVGLGFNGAVTVEVFVSVDISCKNGLVERATRFYRRDVYF